VPALDTVLAKLKDPAEGRLVSQACAEAHPAEVMDLTFATLALAVERLATLAPAGLPARLAVGT
jgi:S-adenosylhomocysteine hydrolase